MSEVQGQMTWKASPYGNSVKVLYLRENPEKPWKSYTAFPQYMQQDPPMFSKGYATYLFLNKLGWKTV